MNRLWKRACLIALAALLCLSGGAFADSYHFLGAGVGFTPPEGWTLLAPETLDAQSALLAALGADADTLKADWAANGGVFTAFLPGGAQVELSVIETDEASAFGEAARMTEGQFRAFLDGYSRAPFENAHFDTEYPGWVRVEWTLSTGGAPVTFARLTTVRQGAQYALTAMGVNQPVDALHEANRAAAAALTFLGMRVGAPGAYGVADLPAPVPDDGEGTPIALVDFTGVSLADTCAITVQTLPSAELTLRTATNALRGRADEEGRYTFSVSTRREINYDYTLTAKAEGRKETQLALAVERRLTGDALEAAYRNSARELTHNLYAAVAADVAGSAGQAVFFRGQVVALMDVGGFPCALFFTDNPNRGVWRNPVWVVLTTEINLVPGEVRTIYGDLRGDAPAFEMSDQTGVAPAVVLRAVAK